MKLEDQLLAITQEFVAKLVDAIRNASFAEVAALHVPSQPAPPRPSRPRSPAVAGAGSNGRQTAGRQTASKRAELGERVLRALEQAGEPLGVRALSGALGVAPDLLAAPLRELRASGRIRKHGEKRATTYSRA